MKRSRGETRKLRLYYYSNGEKQCLLVKQRPFVAHEELERTITHSGGRSRLFGRSKLLHLMRYLPGRRVKRHFRNVRSNISLSAAFYKTEPQSTPCLFDTHGLKSLDFLPENK